MAESQVNDYSNVSFYHDSTKNSLVVFDGSFLMGLDPNNGKSLWKIREFSHKLFIHSLTDNIQLSGNRLVVLSPLEEKSQLIIKTYNRNTGELLWLSDEGLWENYNSETMKKTKITHLEKTMLNNVPRLWGQVFIVFLIIPIKN